MWQQSSVFAVGFAQTAKAAAVFETMMDDTNVYAFGSPVESGEIVTNNIGSAEASEDGRFTFRTGTVNVRDGGYIRMTGDEAGSDQQKWGNWLGAKGGSATLNINGGVFWACIGPANANTSTQSGRGEMQVNSFVFQPYLNQTFNWGTGTIVAGAANVSSARASAGGCTRAVSVTGNPAVFNTGNFAQTIPAAIANGTGTLKLTGGNTVTLSAAPSFGLWLDDSTTCGGFDAEGVSVMLSADAPKWAKSDRLFVNADGNLVLNVKPTGTVLIIR